MDLSKYLMILPVALLAGCATNKPMPSQQQLDPVVSPEMVGLASVQHQTYVVPSAERNRLHTDPMPVRQSDRIQIVNMAGHINENNEAYYRSKKAVIVEKAQWNLDALNNPELSYIPEANSVPVPTAPGRNYTRMVAPGGIAPSPIEALAAGGGKAPLLEDVSAIKVLAIMERSQERQAREFETESETIQYFENLGWCLVPREQLVPSKALPNYNP